MKRRTFLKKTATAIGALVSSTLGIRAGEQQNSHHHNSTSAPDMAAMNHHSSNPNAAMMSLEHYTLGNRRLSATDLLKLSEADKNLLSVTHATTRQALPNLPLLVNKSNMPGQFKATLHAKPSRIEWIKGMPTDFWTYNQSIPGPMIEVYEGDTVEITLINDLPEATTIHWHGLPVPPSEDGNPQDEVKPGEQRIYRFILPEGSAGTYWYHPHGHNTVAEQAYRGLAGTFIVKSNTDPFTSLVQQNWLFSDLKLNADGTIAENSMNDWMNGREGQFTLINGALKPRISLTAPTRIRLWNACSAKYLDLSLAQAKIFLIATDGGFIEKPVSIKTLMLTPGERAELIIVPQTTGIEPLLAKAYDRSKMGVVSPETDQILAEITMTATHIPSLPEILRPLPQFGVAKAQKYIEYTEIMNDQQLIFLVNGKVHDMERIDLVSNSNEVEEWVIYNNTHMDHNFHLHGTQFLVVEHEYQDMKNKPDITGLKDTINLRPYEKIKLHVVQKHKGLRMFHCHILEHETLGMMAQLNVV